MSPYNTSLADQLRPVQKQMHERYSSVMPISQIFIKINPCDGVDPFAAAQKKVLQWIDQRVGQRLPAEAWSGQSFETEKIGAQYAAAVLLDDLAMWGARLDDADKSVPQLTWVTEIGLKQLSDRSIAVSARLACTRRGTDNFIERATPGFHPANRRHWHRLARRSFVASKSMAGFRRPSSVAVQFDSRSQGGRAGLSLSRRSWSAPLMQKTQRSRLTFYAIGRLGPLT